MDSSAFSLLALAIWLGAFLTHGSAALVLFVGSILAARHTARWVGVCLVSGSGLMVLSALASPMWLFLSRRMSAAAYGNYNLLASQVGTMASLIFAAGFFGYVQRRRPQ